MPKLLERILEEPVTKTVTSGMVNRYFISSSNDHTVVRILRSAHNGCSTYTLSCDSNPVSMKQYLLQRSTTISSQGVRFLVLINVLVCCGRSKEMVVLETHHGYTLDLSHK